MVRTVVFLFVSAITIGTLATPFFAPLGILMLLFLLGAVVWWFGLVISTRSYPSEVIASTKRHRFLGPGGPDDPFADDPYEGE